MTPFQDKCLDIINRHNQAHFANWFNPSEVMAFIEAESSFNPNAYRKEPSGVASYGLMQVLDVTAVSYGVHDPSTMYDPQTGILVGMKVAFDYWRTLARLIGRDPTLEEWAASYNAGAGGEAKHIKRGDEDFDEAYFTKWDTALAKWAATGIDQ